MLSVRSLSLLGSGFSRALRLFSAGLLGGILMVSAPCANAADLRKIKLGTPARVTMANAPFLLARELGYFSEEGLELEIVEFLGTSVLVPQIASKAVDIGYSSADVLIINSQPGRDRIPVRFFYNSLRSNVWEFAVLDDSPIKSVGDLRGKKIGIGALANGNVPIIRAMYKEMGMVSGKDYDLVPVGVGAPGVRALSTGEVAAFNGFDAILAQFELAGLKLRQLPSPSKYSNLISNGFAAHEDLFKSDPKMLAAFGRAITKGVVACDANRELCVRSAWKQYPNTRPTGGDEASQMKGSLMLLGRRMERYLDFTPGQPRNYGEYVPQVWRDYLKVLYDGGEMTTDKVDPSGLYTNELVSEFNKFDAQKIVQSVKDRQ